MKIDRYNIIKYVSCSAFGLLYVLVACISLICSVEFFRLAHAGTMSWVLAIGFELGAMCCLLSTLILPKEKQALVWLMFVLLTIFQMMGNTYAAYSALDNYQGWIELFGLEELEPIAQKRVLACISGAILPLVALGFVRTMVNVLQPKKDKVAEEPIAEPLPEPEPEPVPEAETEAEEQVEVPITNEVMEHEPIPEPITEPEPKPEPVVKSYPNLNVKDVERNKTEQEKHVRIWDPSRGCYMDN
jgi:hypothetical protein